MGGYVQWSSIGKHRRTDWRVYLWMYHRLANAGRLQIGRLILTWPMPWSKVCHGQPGYGYGEHRWRPLLVAFGLAKRGH
jgi:hypothetical protein